MGIAVPAPRIEHITAHCQLYEPLSRFELYPRPLCRYIELAILITLNVALILVHCMRACVAKGATSATDICLVHPQELPHLRRQLPCADRWCGQWARGHLRAENTACENAT